MEVVSLEIAKRLKEEGYNRPCKFYWLDEDLPFLKKGLKETKNNEIINHNDYDDFIYLAPNLKDGLNWLIGKNMYYQLSLTLTIKLGK